MKKGLKISLVLVATVVVVGVGLALGNAADVAAILDPGGGR
jgi:hypothetical protein